MDSLSFGNQEFITSIIGVSIPEFSERYIEKKIVTFYKINVNNYFSKTDWLLEKRFSEFDSLSVKLNSTHTSVPVLPGKSLFKISAFEALQKRRIELEQFLKECVCRKDIVSNEAFQTFLEINKYAAELIYYSPVKLTQSDELPLGIRDLFFDPDEGVMFICCSDMNIISRTDSQLTNFNFFWEKKAETYIPLGALLCYSVELVDSTYVFNNTFAKSFPVQTGVISWDKESNLLSVGLDDGEIYYFKHEITSNYSTFDELCNIKPHSDRVMGIGFDMHFGYIYSCSSDKKFVVTDINYQSNMTEIYTAQYGFTNLVYDKPNQRIFLTDEIGGVYVFSSNSFPPTQLHYVQLSSKGSIRGLHLNTKSGLMFTSNMIGKICVLNLPQLGKEKLMNEISTFGGNSKLRVVTYHAGNHEIITGDEQGRVTVWSLKEGQPICKYYNFKK